VRRREQLAVGKEEEKKRGNGEMEKGRREEVERLRR
jgi:hypothetical protein